MLPRVLVVTAAVLMNVGIASADDRKPVAVKKAKHALADFPTLTGKATYVWGYFDTYGPPIVGDSLSLSLKRAQSVQTLFLKRSPKRKGISYIPLPGKLRATTVNFGGRHFRSMRLVTKRGKQSARIDVINKDTGIGVDVWLILEQGGVTTAVIHFDCKADRPFPQKEKETKTSSPTKRLKESKS